MTQGSTSTASDAIAKLRSTGAERATISMALQSYDAALAVVEDLTSEDYQTPQYRALWLAINNLVKRGMEPTLAAVRDSADPYILARIEEAGGREFLERVTSFQDRITNLEHWINELKDRTAAREIIRGVNGLLNELVESVDKNSEPDPMELAGVVEATADNIGAQLSGKALGLIRICESSSGEGHDFDEVYAKDLEEYEKHGGVSGLLTGFDNFDSQIQGFQDGRVYVICAKYKGGKSITMTEFAKRFGVGKQLIEPDMIDLTSVIDLTDDDQAYYRVQELGTNPVPGMIIDTEMQLERDVKPRLLASVGGVLIERINNKSYTKFMEDTARYRKATELIYNSEIWFRHCNHFGKSFENIKALIRQGVHKRGIRWVMFDYIRKPPGVKADEYEYLGDLTYFLKDLADKYNIVIVAGAQLGRSETKVHRGRNKENRAVSSAGIQGSVKIPQAADALLTLEDDSSPDKQKLRIDESRYCRKNTDSDWFEITRQADYARMQIGPIVELAADFT